MVFMPISLRQANVSRYRCRPTIGSFFPARINRRGVSSGGDGASNVGLERSGMVGITRGDDDAPPRIISTKLLDSEMAKCNSFSEFSS